MKNHPPHEFPDVILLLGTDASGKDHVANILVRMLEEQGARVERRQRFFGGRPTTAESSEKKGMLDSLQERSFLLLHSRLGRVLPYLLAIVTRWDLWRYRPPAGKLVVVGHNGLRALAFQQAGQERADGGPGLPAFVSTTLRKISAITGAHTIVLDIDDHVRQQRIATRLAAGSEDNFDRYMYRDSNRSERIETSLVELARCYLNAQLIENNDLAERELRRLILEGFQRS